MPDEPIDAVVLDATVLCRAKLIAMKGTLLKQLIVHGITRDRSARMNKNCAGSLKTQVVRD
jgi:hypothetical protein